MVIDIKNVQLRKQYNQTVEKLQKGSQADKLQFLAQNRYFYDWKLEDVIFLHGQNPLSTAVKTFEAWQELNISVKNGQTATYLMVDKSDLLSKRVSYFDVAQTTQGKTEEVHFPLTDFYAISESLMQVDYRKFFEFGLEEFLRDFSFPVLESYERLNANEKELVPLIATYTLSERLGMTISEDTLNEIKKCLDTEHHLMNVVKVANNLCVRIEQELTNGLARIQEQAQKLAAERQLFKGQFLEDLQTVLSLPDTNTLNGQFEVTYRQETNVMTIAYQGGQLLLTDILAHPEFVAKYEGNWAVPLETLVDLEQLEKDLSHQELDFEPADDLFSFEASSTKTELDYDLILEEFSDESRLAFLKPINQEDNTYFQSTEFTLDGKVTALELKVYSPKGEVDELTENPQSPYIVEVWEDDVNGLQKLGILAYGADYTRDFSYFSNQLQSLKEGRSLENLLIKSGETAYQFLIEETKQEQLDSLQVEAFQTDFALLTLEKTRLETLLAEKGLQDTFSLDIEGEDTLTLSEISLGGILHTVQGEYHAQTQAWELKSLADERVKELLFFTEQVPEIEPVVDQTEEPELMLDDSYTKEIQRGTGTQHGKFPMQALFSEFPNMSKSEAKSVVQRFYSTAYGHSSDERWVNHTSQGIDFEGLGVILSWQEVSEKVRELVIQNDYLTSQQEVMDYQTWLEAEDTQYRDWHDYQDLKAKVQATYQVEQTSKVEAISLFDEIEHEVEIEKQEPSLDTQESYNALFHLSALIEYHQEFETLDDAYKIEIEESVKNYLDREAYDAFGEDSFLELTELEQREIAKAYTEQIKAIARERGITLSDSAEIDKDQSQSDQLFEDILTVFQKHNLGYSLRDNQAKNRFEISNKALLVATVAYEDNRVDYLTDNLPLQLKALFSAYHLTENISIDSKLHQSEFLEPRDFFFPEETSDFYPRTKDDKIAANLKAIRLVKQLEQENKQATPDQQEMLAKYVGWGGLFDVFDDRLEKYETERLALQALVTKEEYSAMELSILTAYYTEPHVIRAMFEKIQAMGFEGGRILEPALGTANFFSAMPSDMREKSQIIGVELDTITGSIAKQLHPDADIRIQGFETTNFYQGAFDLVVGNVPFSDLKIQGESDKKGYMIHDYFIQKSLSLTRENGLVALITSNGTMDKKNQTFRKELANQANFLGAVRLPNSAFSKLAGTKVTSDILFFQKTSLDTERYITEEYHSEIEESVRLENYPDWVTSGATNFSSEIALNTYFEDNPTQILGEVKIQNYHGKTLTVVDNGTPLEESLPRQLKVIEGIYQTGELEVLEDDFQESRRREIPIQEKDIALFTYEIFDRKAYYRDVTGIAEVTLKSQQLSRLSSLIELRKAVQAVFETQTNINGFDESHYEAARLALNNIYDRFVKNYDVMHALANQTLFRKDDHYQLLTALEIPKEKIVNDDIITVYEKAEIFERPTIRKMTQLVMAETALEALQLSLNHRGFVSLDFMTHVYPYPEAQIIAELKGEIYFEPIREQWQSKAEYLSGNVRIKSEEAEQNQRDFPNGAYEENVQALKAVQPEWLPLEMIDYRLGSSWIPWEVYQAFASDILDFDFSKATMSRDENDKWVLKEKGYQPEKSRIYSTKRVETAYLLEKSLNQQFMTVRDKVTNDAGQEHWVFNARETILAQEKQTMIQEAFKHYIESTPRHRKELETTYNLTQNCIVLRQYDGSQLTFDSLNQNIALRPHQKDAVARIVSEQRGLLAHVVGSGKTLTMIASGMKLQELGMVQKPLYVVPNHLVGEFGSEILRAYPDKKVLTTTAKDFEKSNRKAFISRIATGTYDAIVMGMSQFERVPMSLEAQRSHLENQLSDVMAQIREGKKDDNAKFTVKQALQTKFKIEAKLQKLIEGHSKRDTFIDFEELGVDFLFVDESHNFKNLFFQTKHSNVAGINSSASNRATDMYLKVRHIQEHHNGNNVVFATGTPISNSMAEMYTLMNYLEPDVLDQAGIHHFDKWASTFGVIEESVELNVESSNYRKKTRFSRFTNVPELMRLFSSVADVQTQDMLNLPVPEHTVHTVACPITEAQRVYMDTLVERADLIRAGFVDPTTDNMLKLCNDGSKIALDPRLVNPNIFDANDSSKLPTCVDNVYQIWQETAHERSTQLIFSDLGTPQSNKTRLDDFSVYQAIKDELMARGVPSDDIQFIHDANNDKKKERLYQDVRVGKVRILLGSTQKLGTGTNIQDKLLAVHHLDVPWRPSDLEQRNGRIIRQGNENPHVHVFNYVTEGTFDAYRWQVVENKLKYITQVMTSKSPARSMEDVDEAVIDASEVKAIATGNPLLKERAMLENDVNRLKLVAQNYGLEQQEWEKKIDSLPVVIEEIREELTACEQDQSSVTQRFSRENFLMIIKGQSFDKREAAGLALLEIGRQFAKSTSHTEREKAGEIAGLEILLYTSKQQMAPFIQLASDKKLYQAVALNFDSPTGSITRIVNEVASIQDGKYKEHTENHLKTVQVELISAQENFGQPFERAAELQEKNHQLGRLTKAISLDMSLDALNRLEQEVADEQQAETYHQEMGQEM